MQGWISSDNQRLLKVRLTVCINGRRDWSGARLLAFDVRKNKHFVCAEVSVLDCSALKRTGVCLFNGQPLTKKLKRQIGYVMQACPNKSM